MVNTDSFKILKDIVGWKDWVIEYISDIDLRLKDLEKDNPSTDDDGNSGNNNDDNDDGNEDDPVDYDLELNSFLNYLQESWQVPSVNFEDEYTATLQNDEVYKLSTLFQYFTSIKLSCVDYGTDVEFPYYIILSQNSGFIVKKVVSEDSSTNVLWNFAIKGGKVSWTLVSQTDGVNDVECVVSVSTEDGEYGLYYLNPN